MIQPSKGAKGMGLCPAVCGRLPSRGLFEKSPLHPAKTFTLAAKAEGQVVNLPLAGVA